MERLRRRIPSGITDTLKARVEPTRGKVINRTKAGAKLVKNAKQIALPGGFAFLSQGELLRWSESITQSAPSVYDKAMDATYLATHSGGGKHRLFDGSHDLLGAWGRVRDALPDDSLAQEVVGYSSALLKDVTTPGGLPIVTITREQYGEIADQITAHVPGVGKDWVSDMLTFDAFEVLAATLGVASTLFFLKKDDNERLAESLGAMGIVSIISANPLLGISVVLITAYAYGVQKKKVEGKRLAAGASVSGLSLGLFAVLGLPVLLELGIVLVMAALFRKQVLDRDELLDYLVARVSDLPKRVKLARTVRVPSVNWRNVSVPKFSAE